MAGGKFWTEGELSIMCSIYETEAPEKLLEQLPDRKWQNICSKGRHLGLHRQDARFLKGQTPYNAWPQDEATLLKSAFSTLPLSELYALFPAKTSKAIKLKAYKLGLHRPPQLFTETREKYSRWQMGRELAPEHKANVTKAIRRNPPWLGKHLSQKVKDLLSRKAKQRLLDPEYRRKIMSSRRPTDIEQIIIDIIKKYRLPYRYTGDGSFLIGQFNPDFVNTNSQKIALDIFGDRWHVASEIPERTASFAEYGWRLFVLWGHEVKSLSEQELIAKMRGAGRRLKT